MCKGVSPTELANMSTYEMNVLKQLCIDNENLENEKFFNIVENAVASGVSKVVNAMSSNNKDD